MWSFYVVILFMCLLHLTYGHPLDTGITPAAVRDPVLLSNDSQVLQDARFYSKYAASSYCPSQSIVPSYNCSICQPAIQAPGDVVKVIQNDTTATFGFLRLDSSQNAIIVSFRGSKSGTNWLNNIRLSQISYNQQYTATTPSAMPAESKVHNGMWDTFSSIKDDLGKSVQEFLSRPQAVNGSPTQKPREIVLVGHSLGGSLATFAAMHLRMALNIPKEQIRVITYNQPRVGNSAFADFYDSMVPNTLRVVNGNDVFTKLPAMISDYIHFGSEIYTDLDDKTYQCFEREDKRCSLKFYAFDIDKHFSAINQTFKCSD
ncbi:Alpha/Beta hydrolase protein [Paraphysoderma sedebokerense]|nr:Alpha/Beta hydrolase protein [Paraphysoderma sedebokerense]